MAKNSHRPNGQRHQVSSLYSAALRVILVLEIICWEVASLLLLRLPFPQRSRTLAQRPVFLLPVGTRLGRAAKAAQTADAGATVRGLHFVVRLF